MGWDPGDQDADTHLSHWVLQQGTWPRVPGAAVVWFAGAYLLRAGAASKGTDSSSRSRVQAQVNQDDSQLLAVGSRVVQAGVAALSVLLEVSFLCCWFGFHS